MEHQLVLFSYIVEELKDVVRRKFSNKVGVIDALLAKMNYEYVYTPDILDETLFEIRDVRDYPVLYTAILEDVDILVTGDNDFSGLDILSDFSDIQCEERWFCVLLRCDCSFAGRGVFEPGKTSHLFYFIGNCSKSSGMPTKTL